MRPLLSLVPLALATSLLAGTALPALAQAELPAASITIEGTGEAFAAPDTAYVTSGVTTSAETAREALDANTVAMEELIETLRAAGIEGRDIQTSNFSVSPNYVYSDQRDSSGYPLPPRIAGYQVSNTVTIRVRDLDQLGALLDQAVTVGANTIHGISFTVAEPASILDDARRAAFEDARRKGELYAEVAGYALDRLVTIDERQTFNAPVAVQTAAFAAERAASVPVETGELSFTINVAVTWALSADE